MPSVIVAPIVAPPLMLQGVGAAYFSQFVLTFAAVLWAVAYLVRRWQRKTPSPWDKPVSELDHDDFVILRKILSDAELQYVVFRRKLLELDTFGYEKTLADVVREFHNH